MPDVTVKVAGKDYNLACAPGEEDRLTLLAGLVDSRASSIKSKLRHASEGRLMLMTAILIADELADLQETAVTGEITAQAGKAAHLDEERLAHILETYAQQAEVITNRFKT